MGEILAAFATGGACIASNALTTDVRERLVDDFRPHLDSSQWGVDEIGYKDEFFGSKAKRLRPIENHLVTSRVEDILALSEEAQKLLDVSPGGITIYA